MPPKRLMSLGRRLVDRHQHGDLRILGREEADEAGVVHALAGGVEVAVLLRLEAGAGLAGDGEVLDALLRQLTRAARVAHDVAHHVLHLVRQPPA